MDIYFCDECAARVTDLDLRAGKGMRRRHATICVECVDKGLAQAWLTHAGTQPQAAQAQANGSARVAATAVADEPEPASAPAADPISIARDRASTLPDDPFEIDEPAPLKPLPKVSHDTDRLEPVAAPPPAPAAVPLALQDELASAGGGLGALMGGAVPPPPPGLVDEPEEQAPEAAAGRTPPPAADPETPFDFDAQQGAENPGKAETAEVHAVAKDEEPKPRTASGRQAAQGKRSSTTTSKRNAAKPAPTRRGAKAMGSKKLMLMTLISCGVMALVFFGLVLPNVGKAKQAQPEQITEEPYSDFKKSVDLARVACHKAMTADDLAVVRHADNTLHTMMEALERFKGIADKRGYKEENYEELLRQAGFYEVQSMRKAVKDRLFILEQRSR